MGFELYTFGIMQDLKLKWTIQYIWDLDGLHGEYSIMRFIVCYSYAVKKIT